jgi:hypothetical protein
MRSEPDSTPCTLNRIITAAILALLVGFLPVSLSAQETATDTATTPTNYAPALEGLTIYVNISGLASRSRHAKKITNLHQQQALLGYSVIGVQPHIENGDLEGFYVTYTRQPLNTAPVVAPVE